MKLPAGLFMVALVSSSLANAANAPKQSPTVINEQDLKWIPAPAALPGGAEMAVLQGDPTGEGMFTIRLKFPSGYEIATHMHTMAEGLTILSGSVEIGFGEKAAENPMQLVSAGGFSLLPAHQTHHLVVKEDAIIQLTGMGPFDIDYLSSKDTPISQSEKPNTER